MARRKIQREFRRESLMLRLSIRHALATLLAAIGFGPAANALTSPINNGSIAVKLISVGSINTTTAGEPLDLAQPIGDAGNGNRLFVATHGGQIRLIKNGSLVSTPFADLYTA